MSKTTIFILIDRADIRTNLALMKIERLIAKANKNTLRRTTVSTDTLDDLSSDLTMISEILKEIKF